MPADIPFWHLIAGASPIVQGVMALLLLLSLLSWWVIFKKYRVFARARRAAAHFEQAFWSGGELNALYADLAGRRQELTGIEAIFLAGFQEFLRLRSRPPVEAEAVVSGAQRAMRAAFTREVDALETFIPLLATTGSISPYIGLFGTVWGIMNSFRALGAVQQATLAQVAPGIAEALIATAMGLFAAIPAVVAYNRYVTDLDRLMARYDSFMEEFSNILQRHSHSLAKPSADTAG